MSSRRRHPPPASVLTAGFVTVLVGFTSSAAIVFQAARAGGASPAEVASWLEALGIGMAATSIGLSLRYRAPIVTAWSTPGAALLVTSLVGVRLPEAIGAFMFSAVLIVAAGASGAFERAITRIPLPIAQALLAGVLVRFGLGVFTAVRVDPGLVLSMFAVFVVARRWLPRYTMVFVLLVGIAVAVGDGSLRLGAVHVLVTSPRFVAPAFSLATMVSVGIPLFLVTMASQNLPGVAVLRSAGYRTTPISPLITATGLTTLVLAPFGAFAINLAAITAAICAGPEAHEDPTRRYMASVAAGGFYLVVGVFGATVAALFAAFPPVLVAAVAGLALIPTIAASLTGALADERVREPAVITFLVTASGVTLGGIGSAFWGAVAGVAVLGVFAVGRDARPRRSAAAAKPGPASAAGLDSAPVARTRLAPEDEPANGRLPDGPPPLDGDRPAPGPPAGPRRRRATMSGSRLTGLAGAGLGAAVGGILGSSVWFSAVVGFIVLAELPDLVYRARARRGHTDPLLPPWSASEAYLVTLRRWRRSRSDLPD